MTDRDVCKSEEVEGDVAEAVTWSVDPEGRIEAVGDGWVRFAEENQGQEAVPPAILGSRLSDAFGGAEVRSLMEELFRQVRARGEPVTLPFRCDSPSERRDLCLTIRPRPDGGLDFMSRTRAVTPRAVPAMILAGNVERSGRLLSLCAWCKRVQVPEWEEIEPDLEVGSWMDLEEALVRLPILDLPVPRTTHGICPTCREALLQGETDQVA